MFCNLSSKQLFYPAFVIFVSERLTTDIILSKMPRNYCVSLFDEKDKREGHAGEAILLLCFLDDENRIETVALRHMMRPWPLSFDSARDKSLR